MVILYVSALCSKSKFNKLFKNSKVKPAQQAQKYHRLMVEGLVQNEGTKVKVLSAIPLNRSMSDKLYYKGKIENENGIEYIYLPFFNVPLLGQIGLFATCFFSILKLYLKNKKVVVICDVLSIWVSSAALLASKIIKIPNVGIVTDVPAFLAGMANNRIVFKSKLIAMISTIVMNRFNSYVFLTEQMNGLINRHHRPYVVIEGQVDSNMANTINKLSAKYKTKVCLYAGALRKIFSLKILTDAFIAAGVDNTELHIYGSGDFEEELKTICQEHTNIKYFGVVLNDIVVKEQLKATLLVNIRPTNEEYTKYSFPSKNMEYMASGTPLLTTPLPGMPKEYYKYVYILEDESVLGLTACLKEILKKDKNELYQKGIKAKKFVMNKKNNVLQSKILIELIEAKLLRKTNVDK